MDIFVNEQIERIEAEMRLLQELKAGKKSGEEIVD